jgi:hypothetical protein
MADIYLTQEELAKLFSAVHDREMAWLLKQKADLEASMAASQQALDSFAVDKHRWEMRQKDLLL